MDYELWYRVVGLRPTLIYGYGKGKNISGIAGFAHRFGFFLLSGQAQGLWQPIHIKVLASACVAALQTPGAVNKFYNISVGEALVCYEIVRRFFALVFPVRLIRVLLWLFRAMAAMLCRLLPCRPWFITMVLRMNRGFIFDHTGSVHGLGLKDFH